MRVEAGRQPDDEERSMSTLIAPTHRSTRPTRSSRPSRRERRAERKRLRRLDALSSQLAELPEIVALLEKAADVIRAGWVKGAWFAVATPGGRRSVTAYDMRMAEEMPVVGACLVGAVVHAAGGPTEVRSQLVQRSLDLTWHTLRETPGEPVRWNPGPRVRMMSVLELTYWNDAPTRSKDEVVGLLVSAQHAAVAQQERCRAEQLQLGAPAHSA
jgi:hypothetical protein